MPGLRLGGWTSVPSGESSGIASVAEGFRMQDDVQHPVTHCGSIVMRELGGKWRECPRTWQGEAPGWGNTGAPEAVCSPGSGGADLVHADRGKNGSMTGKTITIGILGGGQLARMSAYAAFRMGLRVAILEK